MSELDLMLLHHRFHLTRQEARFVSALLDTRNTLARSELLTAVSAGRSDNPDIKIVDILACRVRKKLQPIFGRTAITTMWGRGYAIDEDMKTVIRAHLAPPQEQAA